MDAVGPRAGQPDDAPHAGVLAVLEAFMRDHPQTDASAVEEQRRRIVIR